MLCLLEHAPELDLDTVLPALEPLRSGLDGAAEVGVPDAGGGVGVMSAVAAYRD